MDPQRTDRLDAGRLVGTGDGRRPHRYPAQGSCPSAGGLRGQNRSTPIKNLERDNGKIVLQGFEKGRAFSFLITEKTGMASIAIAREGLAVSVFGACTPLPTTEGKE